jgi:hypothetical protein
MGVHAAEDARQPVAQAGGLLQLALQEVQALADRREGVRDAAVERGADLRQAEPEAAQRHDPRQPPHVAGAVAPVPGRGALGRHEQADLVVVVQRADREARPPRQLADAERPACIVVVAGVHPSRSVHPHAA